MIFANVAFLISFGSRWVAVLVLPVALAGSVAWPPNIEAGETKAGKKPFVRLQRDGTGGHISGAEKSKASPLPEVVVQPKTK